MTKTVQLNVETAHKLGSDKLKELLSDSPAVNLEMTCWNHGFAQDYNAVAHDYLQALFVGERLFPHCKDMMAKEIHKEGLHPNTFIRFSFIPANLDQVVSQLLELSRLIGEGDDDDIMLELVEELDAFADYIQKNEVRFPELERKYVEYHIDEDEDDFDD